MMFSERVNYSKYYIIAVLALWSSCGYVAAQTIVRNSDAKEFDSIEILQRSGKTVLHKSSFKNYRYREADQAVYNGRLVDFYIHKDTLIFFDQVKEIEPIELVGINYKNRSEKDIKSRKNRSHLAVLFHRQHTATFVKINAAERTFVKSVTVFPRIVSKPKGILQIQIVPNVNGFPDLNSPMLTFDKSLEEVSLKKWEIKLPRIIKYPQNGFFLVFYLKSGEKQNITLRLNKDSDMLFYIPQTQEWKSMNINGYQFQLKVLQ